METFQVGNDAAPRSVSHLTWAYFLSSNTNIEKLTAAHHHMMYQGRDTSQCTNNPFKRRQNKNKSFLSGELSVLFVGEMLAGVPSRIFAVCCLAGQAWGPSEIWETKQLVSSPLLSPSNPSQSSAIHQQRNLCEDDNNGLKYFQTSPHSAYNDTENYIDYQESQLVQPVSPRFRWKINKSQEDTWIHLCSM